jgi:small redox-active disulfide protein 2
MEIKVLGTGCSKCEKLEQLTKDTLAEMGIEAKVEKVEDIYKIMQYGVMRTPGLVIDEKVVLSGRLPKTKELKELLTK